MPIAIVKADSDKHAQFIEFSAMQSGLVVDRAGSVLDITYKNPEKILGVIRRAGGKLSSTHDRLPLGRN